MSDPAGKPRVRDAAIETLDALLQDPERWADLDPERLRHLLFYQCLSYGLQPDEEVIPTLMRLHEVAVRRLHAAVRRQVVVHLARAIERVHREHNLREGAGCTNALLPFLLEDPDPSVVSSAATEMALLLPLEHDDPLTGPRYVRSLLDQASGDDAKAGIIAGLLQLGDSRVAPIVADAWKALGEEGRQTLALLIQGFHGVQAPTVEFLVSWLEDEAHDPQAAAFGVVAATLARAGGHAADHGVEEVRRTFPVIDAPESESFQVVRDLTRDTFAPSIEERLMRAARAESCPQLMPHVLNYWGFERAGYRLAVAAGAQAAAASGAGDGLCDPVSLELAPDWPEEPEDETLIEWAIFNPMGPSINTIRLTPVDGAMPAPPQRGADAALVYTFYHPAGTASWLVALLPGDADAAAVRLAVTRVMARNGSGGVWLLRSLPDYVYVPARSVIGRPAVAAGIEAARRAAIGGGEEPGNLRSHLERLGRLAADPWETVRQEIDREQAGHRAEAHQGDGPGDPSVDRGETYLSWLEVAAAPEHVRAIRDQMPIAWQRAVEEAGRGGGGSGG